MPPYFHQADVWVRLLLEFGWKNIIVMTSANQNGRMLLGRLQSQVESEDIAVSSLPVPTDRPATGTWFE